MRPLYKLRHVSWKFLFVFKLTVICNLLRIHFRLILVKLTIGASNMSYSSITRGVTLDVLKQANKKQA